MYIPRNILFLFWKNTFTGQQWSMLLSIWLAMIFQSLTVSLAFIVSHTDPHEWCHCSQIRLLYKITIWSPCGSKMSPCSSRELQMNLFIQCSVGICGAHCVVSTHKKHLASKPHLHSGLKKARLCVSSAWRFIPSLVPWMRHARVSSEISSLHCFRKSKIMDTLWEDS